MPPKEAPVIDASIEAMRAALALNDRSAIAVCMELDLWCSLVPTFNIPTNLMQKLDAWREASAMLAFYLAEPTIKELRGSTQDQITREAAHNAQPVVTYHHQPWE